MLVYIQVVHLSSVTNNVISYMPKPTTLGIKFFYKTINYYRSAFNKFMDGCKLFSDKFYLLINIIINIRCSWI